jgi:hypothetical protein
MFRIIDRIERLCERIYYGPEDDSTREVSQLQDFQKKERLNRELANAEWILAYERHLTKLQTKTRAQRSWAEQLGANTERLRRLEHHLSELRRNLSLD